MASDIENVCVLSDPWITNWQRMALERMVEETGVTISQVVINDGAESDSQASHDESDTERNESGLFTPVIRYTSEFANLFESDRYWAFVIAERKIAELIGGESPRAKYRRNVDVDAVSCFSDAEKIRCTPITSGAWNELPDEVVDEVSEKSDVVVRFGFGLLTGRILTAPEFGVLSFHPADIRKYRGQGPVQIFLNDESEGGVTLQLLNDDIDAGSVVVIESADISEAYSINEIRVKLNELQIDMLAEGIRRLRDDGFSPYEPDTLGEYHSVEQKQEPRFVAKLLVKSIVERIRKHT